MTEAPLPAGSVKSVDIFVVRIDAKREEPTDDEAAEDTEESEAKQGGLGDGGRAQRGVRSHEARRWYEHVARRCEVAAGAYNGFRLIIDPAKSSVTLNDDANTVIGGESIEGLKFPSAAKTGIKIKLSGGPVEVEEGETSTLV